MTTEPQSRPIAREAADAQRARISHVEHSTARGIRSVLERVEHRVERGGDAIWRSFKKRPLLGVGAGALTGLGLATLVGASELAIAFASGVAVYEVLKKHEPPSKALEEASRFGL